MLSIQIHKPETTTIATSFGPLMIELDLVNFKISTYSRLRTISKIRLCALNRRLRRQERASTLLIFAPYVNCQVRIIPAHNVREYAASC